MDDMIECPKCEYCHEPDGIREVDSWRRTCDGCGFEFLVEVERETRHYTSCIKHEWGEVRNEGTSRPYRTCKYCGGVMPAPTNA